MQPALFISNKKYIDPQSLEGGVKLCTLEYMDLLSYGFTLISFPVETSTSLKYRIKKKLRIDVYEDFNIEQYINELNYIIREKQIKVVFLNMSNTVIFSRKIKELFPDMKVVLCSHGNESGDYLHDLVLHESHKRLQRILKQYTLGSMLTTESENRKYIDLILTVSEVEVMIEKWLGAIEVLLITRIIRDDSINNIPKAGRVGFISDLSHPPNRYGIEQLCAALSKLNTIGIEIRLVGLPAFAGLEISKQFSFITYLGYLDDLELKSEVATWAFALNPVFYYSRGVSTKLGKALGWGIPVITSKKGLRGYQWTNGEMIVCDTPEEFAQLLIKYALDLKAASYFKQQIKLIRESTPTHQQLIEKVTKIINVN